MLVKTHGLVDPEVWLNQPQTKWMIYFQKFINSTQESKGFSYCLTKRMAEDLTDYLDENGIRVRYLHSDIEQWKG
ncbi:MAG: hypothetical protein Ct9H300mP3_10770 [Gammaproteobacteria bacterium]|nr:MAG: hypothetical protein Ct9H300mP3_10770 [Gammaproteobacteria bacterium]